MQLFRVQSTREQLHRASHGCRPGTIALSLALPAPALKTTSPSASPRSPGPASLGSVATGNPSRSSARRPSGARPTHPAQELRFRCAVCGKAFALPPGPRRPQVQPPQAAHAKQYAAAAAQAPTTNGGGYFDETASSESAGCSGPHRCTICRRGFATGQALGGHTSAATNWDGMSVSVSVSASLTASGMGLSGVTVRNFDLNLSHCRRITPGDEEAQSPSPIKRCSAGCQSRVCQLM